MRSLFPDVVASFEAIGRSMELVPGFSVVARWLDAGVDAVAFGIALAWALRWFAAYLAIVLLLAGLNAH